MSKRPSTVVVPSDPRLIAFLKVSTDPLLVIMDAPVSKALRQKRNRNSPENSVGWVQNERGWAMSQREVRLAFFFFFHSSPLFQAPLQACSPSRSRSLGASRSTWPGTAANPGWPGCESRWCSNAPPAHVPVRSFSVRCLDVSKSAGRKRVRRGLWYF